MNTPADSPPGESEYATLIEEAFIAERGTPFLLSSKDWHLIRTWRESGIPADTVVRAVKETFEKRRARGATGRINSISYCATAVEERWEMERRGLVGQGAGRRDEGSVEIGPRLDALSAALRELAERETTGVAREVLRREIDRVAAKLDALPREGSFEEIEGKLSRIEASLVRRLLAAFDAASAAAVEASVAEALGETAGIAPEIVERMRKALTRREVRQRLGLPPITLFGP